MEIFIFVVLGIGFAGYAMYQHGRQKEAWQQAAASMGVDFDDGGLLSKMSVSGVYQGKRIKAWPRTERRGRRRSRRTIHYTVISVELEDGCWQGMSIKEHGLGDSVAKFFGGEDIEVGDSSFDSNFRIKGSLTGQAKECLGTQEVQRAVRQLSRSFRRFKLEYGTIEVDIKERITNSSRLTRLVRRVVDSAQILDEAADPSLGSEPAKVEAQPEKDLFPDLDNQDIRSGLEAQPQPESTPGRQPAKEPEFGSMPEPDGDSGAVW